jgi:hypothetical protein
MSLAFSISPARRPTKSQLKSSEDDGENEEYILTLAPFTRPPKINLGQVRANHSSARHLLIINPQQFTVALNINSTELHINNIALELLAGATATLTITWQPERPDHYKYAIFVEVTNAARLKFLVHAYGVCVKSPDPKKTVLNRRPFTTLQPLRKDQQHPQFAKQQSQQPALMITGNKENSGGLQPEKQKQQRVSYKTVIVTKSAAFVKKAATDRLLMEFYRNELNRHTDDEDDEHVRLN